MFKCYRKPLIFAGGMLFLLPALVLLWAGWVSWYYSRFIYPPESIPERRVAIVFGAQVKPNGQLSSMLRDRVETAVQLYQAGKVQKLVMSGDNRFANYDEPSHMMAYAIERGVPAEDIQPDYAGQRTYDTCYRAKAIFQLDSAVLVTQDFHLPRALFTCRSLGLDAVGVSADLQPYHWRSLTWSRARELPATFAALLDVLRRQPAAILGDPIPIE